VHKTPHALLSSIKKEPTIHHTPPCSPTSISTATSMMDKYHYNPNKSIVHVVNNVVNELPDFPAIARYIQNQAKCFVGSGLTEAQLFREFFGTSVRVVKLL
jgi:hypothetical protein